MKLAKNNAPAARQRSEGEATRRPASAHTATLRGSARPDNDNAATGVLVLRLELDTAPISALIAAAVADALGAQAPAPEWRSSDFEAQRLGVSRATLDRLVREGLPCCRVGDARRFRRADVDGWLARRTAEREQAGAP